MNQPTVCAIMLTRDRHELAAKAVECFRRQTYPAKSLSIFDTGETAWSGSLRPDETYVAASSFRGQSIGALRNAANELAQGADILIHWDDDDWSYAERMTEQVALLQASGADAVGYNQMLFERAARMGQSEDGSSRGCPECRTLPCVCSEQLWLYSNLHPPGYIIGTSLCYWRKTWERHHFADETQGVEDHWLREKKTASVSSLVAFPYDPRQPDHHPRMVARIHAGNTSNGYKLEEYVKLGSTNWKRAAVVVRTN